MKKAHLFLGSAILSFALAGTLTAAGQGTAAPAPGPGEPTLDEVRQLTQKYTDVNVALKEGYIRDPFDLCDTAAMMGQPAARGAMGVHYFRPDLLGVTEPPNPRVNGNGTHTDFRTPAILIYEPQANGTMQLVAVENLVFAKAWREAGHTKPPTYYGVTWDAMIDDPQTPVDEAHQFEPHFDRHVWLYRDNPSGVFSPYNPAVSCANHTGNTHDPATHTTR
jgi:hypothetical protein